MDYVQEYVQVLKTRINDLEIQVAILRSLLPNPPNPPPPGTQALTPVNPSQPPHPQPKPKLILVPQPSPIKAYG